jgi:hypothetical protein
MRRHARFNRELLAMKSRERDASLLRHEPPEVAG